MTTSTTGRRVVAVDITRALAIIGMIAVHSLYAYNAQGGPSLSYSLAAGKSAAAFAVLAGVSISFIVGRKRLAGPAARGKIASLMARAGVIGIIGLLLGYTDGEIAVVILPYYAAMFALAIPLAALSTRALVITGLSILFTMPVLSQLLRPHVPDGLPRQLDFVYLFTAPAEFASDVFLTGQFPALVWMFYICVGLIIGRCHLRSFKTIVSMLGLGAAMVGVAAFASWYILQLAGVAGHLRTTVSAEHAATLLSFGGDGSVPTSSWWWLALNTPHTGTPLDLLTTTGYTMLVLGFLLGLERILPGHIHRVFTMLSFPLAAAGTMALTVYVGHIIFINSPLDAAGAVSTFWWQLVVIGVVSSVWSVLFDRGPLEGMVTSVTKFVERRTNLRHQRAKEAVGHR
ncbi:heparan-alpha-glucosaminide N-acetyltransferase domain-containing protein [Yaniella halotolerans]|uniref:heparan-alpha-glucosaminide N-acetyltransferase domain-containing protein n=1 Tax=Yaniella halotolerans TaxID=225453 RepID=UPI0003B3652A|nr:heparan-alpha-glucosaminide N-acetyltransferase domain-containing protein [Yaniella halotolerans]